MHMSFSLPWVEEQAALWPLTALVQPHLKVLFVCLLTANSVLPMACPRCMMASFCLHTSNYVLSECTGWLLNGQCKSYICVCALLQVHAANEAAHALHDQPKNTSKINSTLGLRHRGSVQSVGTTATAAAAAAKAAFSGRSNSGRNSPPSTTGNGQKGVDGGLHNGKGSSGMGEEQWLGASETVGNGEGAHPGAADAAPDGSGGGQEEENGGRQRWRWLREARKEKERRRHEGGKGNGVGGGKGESKHSSSSKHSKGGGHKQRAGG